MERKTNPDQELKQEATRGKRSKKYERGLRRARPQECNNQRNNEQSQIQDLELILKPFMFL